MRPIMEWLLNSATGYNISGSGVHGDTLVITFPNVHAASSWAEIADDGMVDSIDLHAPVASLGDTCQLRVTFWAASLEWDRERVEEAALEHFLNAR